MVNAYGISPLYAGSIPEPWAAHLRRHIDTQKVTVEAALSGDRHLARQAFIHDPLVAARLTPDGAVEMMEEMLEANRRFLPQFAGAANAEAMLSPKARKKGVWTISAGNAGHGVA